MVLYINACVREESRTDRLARALLKKLGGEYEEVYLPSLGLKPLGREDLKIYAKACAENDFSAPCFTLAKQFADADTIVVSAPYWNISFPALLWLYFDNIYVQGVVTRFLPDGSQIGLCRGKKLYYVATAGGDFKKDYGYSYAEELVKTCFGVQETELIFAEKLDLQGYDAEQIMRKAMQTYGLEP